jgi:lipopolysaccharide biosynthesis glycosyltransferase
MNCIFFCVFTQEKYVDMSLLLLESIITYGNLNENTDILIYTSTEFMEKIKISPFNCEKIKFEINETYDNIEKACRARLDVFNLASIKNYNKILYLDTDIIVTGDLNKVFDVCEENILYVLQEGAINLITCYDWWGMVLFGEEVNNYEDKTAFTSGIMLFNNCEIIEDLFNKINEDIINRGELVAFDQPFIIYNAFKYNLYNNKKLFSLVHNVWISHQDQLLNPNWLGSGRIIHHFPGGPGCYGHKIDNMTFFLNNKKKTSLGVQIYRDESELYMENNDSDESNC